MVKVWEDWKGGTLRGGETLRKPVAGRLGSGARLGDGPGIELTGLEPWLDEWNGAGTASFLVEPQLLRLRVHPLGE